MAIDPGSIFSKLGAFQSDHDSVVSMNLFVALLCACIVIGHLLEETRWMNESITALAIVRLCNGVSEFEFYVVMKVELGLIGGSILIKFIFYCRVFALELLFCLLLEERVPVFWYSVKIFSLSIFFHPSYLMPGKFDLLLHPVFICLLMPFLS